MIDGQVMTPMQKIVADACGPRTRATRTASTRPAPRSTAPTRCSTTTSTEDWLAGPAFTVADCAAAPALFYANVVHRWDEAAPRAPHAYFERLTARPSVARVIDEARPYREIFPLGLARPRNLSVS